METSPPASTGSDFAEIMFPLALLRPITHLQDCVKEGTIGEDDLKFLLAHGVERICHLYRAIARAGKGSMANLVDYLKTVPEHQTSHTISYILDTAGEASSTTSLDVSPELLVTPSRKRLRDEPSTPSTGYLRSFDTTPSSAGSIPRPAHRKTRKVSRENGGSKGRQRKHCPECRISRAYEFQDHLETCLPELKGVTSTTNTLIACGYCTLAGGHLDGYQGKAFGYDEYKDHIEDDHGREGCPHWDLNLAMNNILTHDRLIRTYREYLGKKEPTQRRLVWARSDETMSLLKRLQTFAGSHTDVDPASPQQSEVEELLESAYASAGKIDAPSHDSRNVEQTPHQNPSRNLEQTLHQNISFTPDYDTVSDWTQSGYPNCDLPFSISQPPTGNAAVPGQTCSMQNPVHGFGGMVV